MFDEVEFYVADKNVVTIAYDGPARDEADLRRIAEERQEAFDLRYDLTKMLAQRRRLSSSYNFV